MTWEPMETKELVCACCHKPQAETLQMFKIIQVKEIRFLRCPECEATSLAGIMQIQSYCQPIKKMKSFPKVKS